MLQQKGLSNWDLIIVSVNVKCVLTFIPCCTLCHCTFWILNPELSFAGSCADIIFFVVYHMETCGLRAQASVILLSLSPQKPEDISTWAETEEWCMKCMILQWKVQNFWGTVLCILCFLYQYSTMYSIIRSRLWNNKLYSVQYIRVQWSYNNTSVEFLYNHNDGRKRQWNRRKLVMCMLHSNPWFSSVSLTKAMPALYPIICDICSDVRWFIVHF